MFRSSSASEELAQLSRSWPDFCLPSESEAGAPPEERGLCRDGVRLLVTWASCGCTAHESFRALPSYLRRGDVLVVNASRTLPAALPAVASDGRRITLHFSSRLPGGQWLAELRRLIDEGGGPLPGYKPGERLSLPGGRSAVLGSVYDGNSHGSRGSRLCVVTTNVSGPWPDYLLRYGRPIRYSHVGCQWPLSYYQTIFGTEWGSAEMPSAARPFTTDVLGELDRRGISIAPLVLHSGVSSPEFGEAPQPEYFKVTEPTVRRVNRAKQVGARVIAVGTTVVRALETAASADGLLRTAEGWTDRIVSPQAPPVVANSLITGFHEPKGSHLMLVEAFLGRDALQRTYAEALKGSYLWHEFGDVQFIIADGHC
jgi:S-adenosylmethionine:tRNA ribosyltransferase-isomerase